MVIRVFSKTTFILEGLRTAVNDKLRENQAGFHRKRSCKAQIATLRIIVEQYIEWNCYPYVNFVDYEKHIDTDQKTNYNCNAVNNIDYSTFLTELAI